MRVFIQRFIIVSLIVCLVLGFSFSTYSKNGGPAWAHWLGHIFTGALTTVVGLTLVIGSATSKEFVRKLYSLHNPNYKIDRSDRLSWIAIGLVMTLFGGYLFISTISQNPNCRNISC
jgi:hypothetical protein